MTPLAAPSSVVQKIVDPVLLNGKLLDEFGQSTLRIGQEKFTPAPDWRSKSKRSGEMQVNQSGLRICPAGEGRRRRG